MKKLLLALFLLLVISAYFFPQNAFGGAWTLPKYHVWGEYYFKWHWSDSDFESGSSYANANFNQKDKGGRSWGWVMEPKIEFGVTDWLTFLTSLEYKESWYKESNRPVDWGPFERKNHGIANIKIGAKLRFLKEPVVFSGQFKFFIYPGYGNYRGDDPAYRHQPSIGEGEDAFELRGLIGKEFYVPIGLLFDEDWSTKCYVNVETGYRWKNKEICNDVPFIMEGGIWVGKWVIIKGEIDGYLSHGATGSKKKRYAIWRIGPIFKFLGGDPIARIGKQFNIELQYGQVFAGKNTSADQEITLKLQSEF